jgi:hypothetical protein
MGEKRFVQSNMQKRLHSLEVGFNFAKDGQMALDFGDDSDLHTSWAMSQMCQPAASSRSSIRTRARSSGFIAFGLQAV